MEWCYAIKVKNSSAYKVSTSEGPASMEIKALISTMWQAHIYVTTYVMTNNHL